MKDKFDWKIIRIATIVFASITGVVLLMNFSAYYFFNERQLQYNREIGGLDSARSDYLHLIEQYNLYVEYANQFKKLKVKGIIGDENRLSWVEAIQKENSRLKLPKLEFRISAQTAFPDEDLDFKASSIYVGKTPMALEMGLLHEQDLIELLNAVNKNAKGYFMLEECKLIPTDTVASQKFSLDRANIIANCTLSWISVNTSGEAPASNIPGAEPVVPVAPRRRVAFGDD